MEFKEIYYKYGGIADYRESWRIFRIMAEFVDGYQFLSNFQNEITIFGSARLPRDNYYYKEAEKLSYLLSKKGFTIITGGGPGIMEAANKGAYQAGGESVGLNIQLPFEQVLNPYVTKSTSFSYFFTRKVMLTSPAQAFVFFPGGFGTFDEFFEVLDHIELGFMPRVPIVLVGREYWMPILNFLKEKCSKVGIIPFEDLDKLLLVDSAEEAFYILRDLEPIQQRCDLSSTNFKCYNNINWRIFRIMAELVEGFEFITGVSQGITVFGTKNIPRDSVAYIAAYNLGQDLAKEKCPIITGGKSGIAEAVIKGAYEYNGYIVGIDLDDGKVSESEKFLTKSIKFKFPFTRKLIITAPTKAFVFFPGGFGTLHQLFEVLTLLNTKKMKRLPVILFNREYWQPLHWFIKTMLVHNFETIKDEDDELYQIVDEYESIYKIIDDFYR